MVKAFVMMNVERGVPYRVYPRSMYKEKIETMVGVKEVNLIFGRYDIHVSIEAEKLEDILHIIDDEIRNIPGVKATETFIAF